jgi:hypothetical protein
MLFSPGLSTKFYLGMALYQGILRLLLTSILDGREHYEGTRPKTRYGEVWELGLGVRGGSGSGRFEEKSRTHVCTGAMRRYTVKDGGL